MQKIVVDTNVIISAAISNKGSSAEIVRKISDGELELLYNVGILVEYADVLARNKFGFSIEKQTLLLKKIIEMGTVFNPVVSDIILIDEDDRIFYDTAKEANAILITGNSKHYPNESFIMSPSSFIEIIK